MTILEVAKDELLKSGRTPDQAAAVMASVLALGADFEVIGHRQVPADKEAGFRALVRQNLALDAGELRRRTRFALAELARRRQAN